jgi:protein tyrosine/serine phosphatase
MSATALPSPPFLPADAELPNLRDLGGYPTPLLRPDHVTRPGLVFRAAAPTAAAAPALARLAVADLYDLRSEGEVDRHPGPPASAGLNVHRVPVFPDRSYTPQDIALRFQAYADADPADGFGRAYSEILAAGGPGAFTPVLRHLARPDPPPLLVHCTAGKDRTGVVCALVLALCGVPDETIAWEYALTELGLASKMSEFMEILQEHPAMKDNPEGARRMLGARPEAMRAMLRIVREKYGSVEDYVRTECGLSAEEILLLRDNLVVPASSVDKAAIPALPA